MTELEVQLTAALNRLSGQYERERRRQSERAEALQEQVEALRRQVGRQVEQSEILKRQVERLSGRVTRLTEFYGSLVATSRGRWR